MRVMTEEQVKFVLGYDLDSPGEFDDGQCRMYVTEGGSFMVATSGTATDDHEPHDIACIGYYGSVVALTPTCNPELIEDLREIVDVARARHAQKVAAGLIEEDDDDRFAE